MNILPDQCMWMWIYLPEPRTSLHSVGAPWPTHRPLPVSLCVMFSTANNAALIILALMLMCWVSRSRNSFCWVPRYVQFLFTQIIFTKGWNSYFYWSRVRGQPSYQHQILTSRYCSTKLVSFIHTVFLSLGERTWIFLDTNITWQMQADDSHTLTIERAEGWVWRAQTKRLQTKVKDGCYHIICNLEECFLMGIGSAFWCPYYLLFEPEASSIRAELSAWLAKINVVLLSQVVLFSFPHVDGASKSSTDLGGWILFSFPKWKGESPLVYNSWARISTREHRLLG